MSSSDSMGSGGRRRAILDVLNVNDAKLQKHGIVVDSQHELGAGSWGIAYKAVSREGRTALKVTEDALEAITSNGLVGKRLKRVVTIFDVFRFKGEPRLYGILQEFLQPLSKNERRGFDHLADMLDFVNVEDEIVAGDIEGVIAKASTIFRNPHDNAQLVGLIKRFDFGGIIEELHQNGVDFLDFHAGNLMKRGNVYVLIDLGMSHSAAGSEPRMLERGVR